MIDKLIDWAIEKSRKGEVVDLNNFSNLDFKKWLNYANNKNNSKTMHKYKNRSNAG